MDVLPRDDWMLPDLGMIRSERAPVAPSVAFARIWLAEYVVELA